MGKVPNSINLLPNKGGGFTDQFLGWALTVGRLLVILVETLALGTFFYRFSIDMKIIDLHDLIKHQSLIVSSFEQNEVKYRKLQSKLLLPKTVNAAGKNSTDTLSDIIEMGRTKVTFKTILVSSSNARIELQTTNGNALNLFVDELSKYPKILSVNIENIENNTSNSTINAVVTANVANE